jgi:MFS family permease
VINNLGSMSQALSGENDRQELLVILLSVFNCLGRMFAGYASDATARWLSRPAWLTLTVASMTGCMAVTAFADWGMLYLTAAWTGFSYGAFWSLGPR